MQNPDNARDTLAEEEFGLDELTAPAPDQNPDENAFYRHESLERRGGNAPPQEAEGRTDPTSRWLTQLYIISYLIFFSIFGVLARIGLQALTLYPGALVGNSDLWANFGGSLLIGMLREDRMLFRRHWRRELQNARGDISMSSEDTDEHAPRKSLKDAARAPYATAISGVPAYIGMTVGFCGSFTSFASVCRDAFLAIADKLDTARVSTSVTLASHRARSAGDSVMALLAVLLLEVGLSIIGLNLGAHLASGLARPSEKIPVWNLSRFMDPLFVLLGPGCWLGAILLVIWPVHNAWRGQALFALVFAPVGCLVRFQLSVRLNRLARAFPIGTFAANVLGTCILGLAYDLQMSSAGTATLSCQVLMGIMDGFCGALTTVSTWVLELDTLSLRHAYFYGLCSLFIGVGFITVIMGSLLWTTGFRTPSCKL